MTPFDLKNAVSQNRLVGLWRLLSGYRLFFLAATFCLAVSATAKTCTYLLLRYLIDDVIPQPGMTHMLPWIAAGFLTLASVEGGFTYFSGRLAAYASESTTLRLRNYLFDHIQRLSFAYHSKTPTGELIQRATSDVDALRRFYTEQAPGMGRILLLFSINLTAIFQLNSRLALASIVTIPLIATISVYFFKKVFKAYEAYQEQEATLTTTLQENLTGVRVVKAFARQDYERQKFEKDNWEKYLRGRRLLLMQSQFWPISDIVCGFQMLGGFILAAWMAIHGEISVGDYLAYAGLVIWLIWPIRNLGRLIVQTSTGLVSYGRVMEVIRQDREPLDEGDFTPSTNLRGDVVFKHVGFAYESDSPVLQDISFHCRPGQIVALIGSTGSGKTTLVNLLPRFYEYTDGSLLLDGVELNRYPRGYLRRQIGIVEQEPFLFSRSLRDNITFGVGRQVGQDEIEAATHAAAIHDVITSFPAGYDTLVGEKGVTLSGGQKQRVAIARALLKDPRLLILDDSTSSVDTETEAEIRSALDVLMNGRTTFIIAHRIQSVMNADLILVLDQGKVIQQGTHEQLLAQVSTPEQPNRYRQIFDIQTRIEEELAQEIARAECYEPANP